MASAASAAGASSEGALEGAVADAIKQNEALQAKLRQRLAHIEGTQVWTVHVQENSGVTSHVNLLVVGIVIVVVVVVHCRNLYLRRCWRQKRRCLDLGKATSAGV